MAVRTAQEILISVTVSVVIELQLATLSGEVPWLSSSNTCFVEALV
jgi:hypothetical protein